MMKNNSSARFARAIFIFGHLTDVFLFVYFPQNEGKKRMKREWLARRHRHLPLLCHNETANQDIKLVCSHVFNFSVFAHLTKKPPPDVLYFFKTVFPLNGIKCSFAYLPTLKHFFVSAHGTDFVLFCYFF